MPILQIFYFDVITILVVARVHPVHCRTAPCGRRLLHQPDHFELLRADNKLSCHLAEDRRLSRFGCLVTYRNSLPVVVESSIPVDLTGPT